MKILFSPSESKSNIDSDKNISKDCFVFEDLFNKRMEIVNIYNEFIKNITEEELCKLFGLKTYNDSLRYDLFEKGCVRAILRYNGVAYKYLDYLKLDEQSKNYINNNVLIFSNLFGPILAKDMIPEYKLKQGERIQKLNIEKFYKDNFSLYIDEFLKDEVVLDLRAGYYEKFYDIKKEYFSFKFIKNGKVVSHFAKAYRGILLKELASNNTNTKDELMNLNIEGLKLLEIRKIKSKNELIFEIIG
ncbi:hypothetical protein BFG05_02340 [Campylobacter pinnipediorum subsp. pinnipediorum]|uniref:YaaA family protein n=1 Tax=Campylobacter pinnipediorum TaxID=1965231 RepID=UPI0009956EB5|nr:YaaA family protein [Campylobacter pinnipediorum]OPA78071.1 hypothetical protein BFG05_02340 [Campylobacter pinnipediorum subsp. pinnipediorum]